ncbi:MAG TPA: ShlB/FhaC/HecB family hemolysin secretion/activation protein, partial [Spongiibacteraceae bacterium]
EGNTLLETERIETSVSPYLGPQRAISDVNAAAANLERAFRDAGYPTIYVDVPEQNVVDGVVTLRITEGRIGRVHIEGARYFSPNGIREKLASVQPGEVLHVPAMQAELNAVNAQSADLKVVPVLKPGKTPGLVDVDLKVKDSNPLHGSVDLNNYNSANTTESRLSVGLSYDNLWQQQHSLAVQWQTAPQKPSEVDVLVATYIAPWFDTNNRVAIYAIDSNSDVASVGSIDVVGNGKIYGARFVMPLPSDRKYVQSFSFGADYKDYSEIIRLDPTNKIKTPIDYAVWTFQYNATQFTPSSQLQWSLSANFGIRGVGNSDQEFIDKRNRAQANFAYLRGSIDRTDTFATDWQLLSSFRAQFSNSPLINNEQFSAGGSRSVRGYYESQVLGDNGVSLGLEMRTPKLIDKIDKLDDLRLLAFLEGARLRVQDALPGQEDTIDIAGTGIGFVMRAWNSVDLTMDWAYALKQNGNIDRGDQRIGADLLWKF